MADAAVEATDEEHRRGNAGGREDRRVGAGSRGKLDDHLPDGADGAVDVRRQVTHAQDVLRRGDERVLTAGHRNGARVAGLSGEDTFATDDPDDPPGKAHRSACPLEHWALLDVHLEEALRQLAALDEGGAADAPGLFFPEDDDCTFSDALDRLDRHDDAQGSVELAPVWHGV